MIAPPPAGAAELRSIPATPDAVPALLARVEPRRAAAMAVSMGGDPLEVITASLGRSGVTWCWADEAGPVAIGGAEPVPGVPAAGYVWQIVASDLVQHKREYLEASRAQRPVILAVYPTVYSLIEADNDAALRHVARMGGTVGATVMKGARPMRFCVLSDGSEAAA